MKTLSTLLGLGLVLSVGGIARGQQNNDVNTMRRQVIAWFKDVNIGGANGKMATFISQRTDRIMADGRHVCLKVAGDLTRSGKAYYALTMAGGFHVFELTPAQARLLDIKAGTVGIGSGAPHTDTRAAKPLARLDGLHIENAGRLDGNRSIAGKLTCQCPTQPTGRLVLRLTYKLNGSTVAITKPLRSLPVKGTLNFSMGAINRNEKTPHVGPLPLFVDLCLESGMGFDRKLTVVSNTLAILLDIPAAAGAPVPGLAGTKWQFSGTKTTVEFLTGGRALFNFGGQTASGNWKREGKKLVFDCNAFTQWEVEIQGDRMTGTWKRLRGNDVGKSYPTSLQRVTSR